MNFQYSDETKWKFEQMKPKQIEINAFTLPDNLLPVINSTALEISDDFENFLEREFEKCGYRRDELINGNHKLEIDIQLLESGYELHQCFVDGRCVLKFYKKFNIDFKEESPCMGYEIYVID